MSDMPPRNPDPDAAALLDRAGLTDAIEQIREAVAARVARDTPPAPGAADEAELTALRTRAADAEAEAARFAAERDAALARVATAEATITAVTEALTALRASLEV